MGIDLQAIAYKVSMPDEVVESEPLKTSNNNREKSKTQPMINDPLKESVDQTDPHPSDSLDHRFECRACGYIYDPDEGVKKLGIEIGTAFENLDHLSFRCPVCRATKDSFRDIGPRDKPSGFEENLNYGFGANSLTPGQKNVLIFGGLALAVSFFLSLYSLR